MSLTRGYAQYNDDGSIEISGNREGYPRFTAVCPTPDINTPSEEERERRHKMACDGLYLQGYYIISRRRVRNAAFDAPNQKTTLKIRYRPCKTKTETKEVYTEIKRVLRELEGKS